MFPDSPASLTLLQAAESWWGLGTRPGNEARECTITLLIIILQVTSSALIVGGALSLTDLVSLLQANQDRSSTFEHLASHLLKVITCMRVQLSGCLVPSDDSVHFWPALLPPDCQCSCQKCEFNPFSLQLVYLVSCVVPFLQYV